MKIFNLLNEYTSDTGSWSIEYNNHKLTYSEPDEYYTSHDEDDSDELDGINTKQDIYRLYWFNDTPIGHYCILANSIEELEEKIIDVIREERLTRHKTEEIKPKTDLNISCKYKIQIENKFDDKPYCTCFCELCEDLPICDNNCQIFEDYKELVHYKRTLKEINNLIFPDIKDASITPIAITEIRERLYQSLKLPENNKNTAIMRNIYECIKNSFCKYCGIYICKGCLYFDIKKAIKKRICETRGEENDR